MLVFIILWILIADRGRPPEAVGQSGNRGWSYVQTKNAITNTDFNLEIKMNTTMNIDTDANINTTTYMNTNINTTSVLLYPYGHREEMFLKSGRLLSYNRSDPTVFVTENWTLHSIIKMIVKSERPSSKHGSKQSPQIWTSTWTWTWSRGWTWT